MTKENFCKVWKDSTREEILNQYYYDYTELKETIDKALECIKEYEELTGLTVGITANLIFNLKYILQGEDKGE